MTPTVQEALANLDSKVSFPDDDRGRSWPSYEADRDALIEAVRAEERARCVAAVEKCTWSPVHLPFMTEAECQNGYAHLIRKSNVLAALTGADT